MQEAGLYILMYHVTLCAIDAILFTLFIEGASEELWKALS